MNSSIIEALSKPNRGPKWGLILFTSIAELRRGKTERTSKKEKSRGGGESKDYAAMRPSKKRLNKII